MWKWKCSLPFQGVWRACSVLPVASTPTGTSPQPPAAPSQASGRSPRPALPRECSGTFRGLPKSVGCAVKAENAGKGAGSAPKDIHHAWRLVSQRWVWLAPRRAEHQLGGRCTVSPCTKRGFTLTLGVLGTAAVQAACVSLSFAPARGSRALMCPQPRRREPLGEGRGPEADPGERTVAHGPYVSHDLTQSTGCPATGRGLRPPRCTRRRRPSLPPPISSASSRREGEIPDSSLAAAARAFVNADIPSTHGTEGSSAG